jgi:hypothetical protein
MKIRIQRSLRSTLRLALLFLPLSHALAQSYSINWYKISGGGGTATGGVFTVSTTIGQHDAGSMSGGPFQLTGGFWAPIAVQTVAAPRLLLSPAGPGQATLTWSPEPSGYYLQTSDSLASPLWSNAPSGTNHPVTIPTTGPIRFYRLFHP